jgi:hypothetical protein
VDQATQLPMVATISHGFDEGRGNQAAGLAQSLRIFNGYGEVR